MEQAQQVQNAIDALKVGRDQIMRYVQDELAAAISQVITQNKKIEELEKEIADLKGGDND